MKRLITGHDQSGKSVFVNEGELPRQLAHAAGGFGITQVWATEWVPVLPAPGGDPALERHKFFPGHGGTRFLIARFPPAAAAEQAAQGESTRRPQARSSSPTSRDCRN